MIYEFKLLALLAWILGTRNATYPVVLKKNSDVLLTQFLQTFHVASVRLHQYKQFCFAQTFVVSIV